MNLDEAIITLLKKYRGRVNRGKMWEHFDNYSRGYLDQRLRALKLNGYTKEVGGWYLLTKKGWRTQC